MAKLKLPNTYTVEGPDKNGKWTAVVVIGSRRLKSKTQDSTEHHAAIRAMRACDDLQIIIEDELEGMDFNDKI